jgi:hypothetical protein
LWIGEYGIDKVAIALYAFFGIVVDIVITTGSGDVLGIFRGYDSVLFEAINLVIECEEVGVEVEYDGG